MCKVLWVLSVCLSVCQLVSAYVCGCGPCLCSDFGSLFRNVGAYTQTLGRIVREDFARFSVSSSYFVYVFRLALSWLWEERNISTQSSTRQRQTWTCFTTQGGCVSATLHCVVRVSFFLFLFFFFFLVNYPVFCTPTKFPQSAIYVSPFSQLYPQAIFLGKGDLFLRNAHKHLIDSCSNCNRRNSPTRLYM